MAALKLPLIGLLGAKAIIAELSATTYLQIKDQLQLLPFWSHIHAPTVQPKGGKGFNPHDMLTFWKLLFSFV